jgi:hypothetical protein
MAVFFVYSDDELDCAEDLVIAKNSIVVKYEDREYTFTEQLQADTDAGFTRAHLYQSLIDILTELAEEEKWKLYLDDRIVTSLHEEKDGTWSPIFDV